MTEAEWHSCTDPHALLGLLREQGKLTDRKARLFAVACCRRIWPLLADERSRRAVAVAERYADGAASYDELDHAFAEAFDVYAELDEEVKASPEEPAVGKKEFAPTELVARAGAAWTASDAAHPDESVEGTASSAAYAAGRPSERGAQADLLRCIAGSPFRPPPALDPALLTWDDGLVVKLAQAAYDERALPSGELDSHRLGVLADALEEAGCSDAALLEHLRAPGPHLRGCHGIDAILERS